SNAGGVIVGYGEGENFIASDIPALLEHTRRMSFLDHGEMAVVTKDAVSFRALDGKTIEKTVETIALDPIAAAKSGYKHFMLKEIHEQPRAISDSLLGRVERSTGRVVFDSNVRMDDAFVRAIPRISFVACGTASHAALGGKSLVERRARGSCSRQRSTFPRSSTPCCARSPRSALSRTATTRRATSCSSAAA